VQSPWAKLKEGTVPNDRPQGASFFHVMRHLFTSLHAAKAA
jgi:hypothetical protein